MDRSVWAISKPFIHADEGPGLLIRLAMVHDQFEAIHRISMKRTLESANYLGDGRQLFVRASYFSGSNQVNL
jgi:hypothetical protein